jgi:hypothetical protein
VKSIHLIINSLTLVLLAFASAEKFEDQHLSLQIPANWSTSTDPNSMVLTEKEFNHWVDLVELDSLPKNETWDSKRRELNLYEIF